MKYNGDLDWSCGSKDGEKWTNLRSPLKSKSREFYDGVNMVDEQKEGIREYA